MSSCLNGELSKPVKICLFGAAPDTPNLGVSALFLSVVNAIAKRYPDAQLTVFDHGSGPRPDSVLVDGVPFGFLRCGANLSYRIHRRDSLFNMQFSAAFGGLGNPGVNAIQSADAVLDISGGDSFADIYGWKRFRMMTRSKQLTLKLKTPLILLPQTYGPFEVLEARRVAEDIMLGAEMAWARDLKSFGMLKSMLGNHFDEERHAVGVDVAFALPARRPDDLPKQLKDWLTKERTRAVVGLNVSGLIYNQGEEGSRRFGFKGDYREIIHQLLKRFLDGSDANIVLIPHVLSPAGHYESDLQASEAAASTIRAQERLYVLDRPYDATEMKWVISQLDFFCGTRMHSTIAGLSSNVPTTAIAYSKKTLGVFDTCGHGHCVTDPRYTQPEQCVEDIWQAWRKRESIAASLSSKMPDVRQRAQEQMERILERVGASGKPAAVQAACSSP